jgi:hypothetical protein
MLLMRYSLVCRFQKLNDQLCHILGDHSTMSRSIYPATHQGPYSATLPFIGSYQKLQTQSYKEKILLWPNCSFWGRFRSKITVKCICVCVCVRARARACVRACVRVRVCVLSMNTMCSDQTLLHRVSVLQNFIVRCSLTTLYRVGD